MISCRDPRHGSRILKALSTHTTAAAESSTMAEGPAKKPAPNLQKLEETYRIVGELRGTKNVRRYVAQRRQGGIDVIISVVTAAAGSEHNELSHYAADVQLLVGEHHPVVVDVLESRWLDGGALAVVTARENGTTLGDSLDRGERLSNPRTASILQDVLYGLEWARARGVVHRGVSPDDLFLDDGSQRVRVLLAPTLIPITGVPDACADARTIGELAWAMLSGKTYEPGKRRSLRELAPNLATRVVDATEQLIGCAMPTPNAPAPDVATVIGVIAAGDVLKRAEVEISAMKEEYQEQHRIALAKCENRRLEVEQQAAETANALADERADFERQMTEEKAALAEERADFERVMAERQAHFAQIRETLEQQAEDLERRLAEFDERRSEFQRVVLRRQREQAEAGSAPDFALKPAKERAGSENKIRKALAPFDGPARRPAADARARRRWLVPATLAAVSIAAIATAFGLRFARSRTRDAIMVGKTDVAPTSPTLRVGSGLSRGGFISPTVGGTVVTKALGAPTAPARDSVIPPSTPIDTAPAGTAPRMAPNDSATDVHGNVPMPAAAPEPRPHRYPSTPSEPDPRDTARIETLLPDSATQKTTRVVDPATGRTTPTVTDSIVRITGTRRDTFVVRPGERHESAKPDTSRKSDTSGVRPYIPPP